MVVEKGCLSKISKQSPIESCLHRYSRHPRCSGLCSTIRTQMNHLSQFTSIEPSSAGTCFQLLMVTDCVLRIIKSDYRFLVKGHQVLSAKLVVVLAFFAMLQELYYYYYY